MDFVAFDLETTGVDTRNDAIVEIGAVRFVDFKPEKGFNCLVNPGCPIPESAARVHGISDADVADKPSIQEVIPDFTAYCGDLPLVAHNAKFDFKFLCTAVEKFKKRAPSGVVLDTYTLSKVVFPGLPNYRLGTLVRHFDFPGSVFHRAEEDAAYCGLLFARILQALQKTQHPHGISDLQELAGMKDMRFPVISESNSAQLGLF